MEKQKPNWFNPSNYEGIPEGQTGLALLGRLLYIRQDLYNSDVIKVSRKYQQIIAGDPLLKGPGFVVTPIPPRSAVNLQSVMDTISVLRQMERYYPAIATGEQYSTMDLAHMDINPLLQNIQPNNKITVVVDLESPKEKLIDDFKALLEQEKKRYGLIPKTTKTNSKSPKTYFTQFVKYKVLQYLDIKLWLKAERYQLTNTEIGKLIYSPDYDSAIDKSLVNHTIPYADRALDSAIIMLLWRGTWD